MRTARIAARGAGAQDRHETRRNRGLQQPGDRGRRGPSLPTDILFTPALTRTLIASKAVQGTWYAMQLVHGSRDIPTVEKALIRMLPSGSDANFTGPQLPAA